MKVKSYSILLIAAIFILSGCSAGRLTVEKQFEAGQYEKALKAGKNYLIKHPDDWMTRRLVGDAAYALGDTLQAYDIYRPAAYIYIVEQPRLGRRLVRLAMERGDFTLADSLLEYEEAFGGSELLRQIHYNLRQVVDQMRISAVWDVQRGDSAVVRQEWLRAYEFYQRASESYPRPDFLARELCMRAWFLADTTRDMDIAGMEETLHGAMELVPSEPIVYYLAGLVERRAGRKMVAERYFTIAQQFVDHEPWSRLARQALEVLR